MVLLYFENKLDLHINSLVLLQKPVFLQITKYVTSVNEIVQNVQFANVKYLIVSNFLKFSLGTKNSSVVLVQMNDVLFG